MAASDVQVPGDHPVGAEHGPSVKSYLVVFVALLALTGLTTAAAYAEMPAAWHTPVALAIAAAKALHNAVLASDIDPASVRVATTMRA